MQSIGQPTHYRFESEGRQLNALVYGSSPHQRSGTVVAFAHGLAGDMWGNGTEFVPSLASQLPLRGLDFACLQRGGAGASGYTGGQLTGSSLQTLEQEVADTTAGLRGLAELYRRVVPLGFSAGFLVMAAAVTPEFRQSIAPSGIDRVIGLSPVRMNRWMAAVEPDRHPQLVTQAERAVKEGDPDRLIVADQQPYDLPWRAAAYLSLSSAAADTLPRMRSLHEQGVGLYLAYGYSDTNVRDSYGGFDTMEADVLAAHPLANIATFYGANHGFAGHERGVVSFVLKRAVR